MSICLDCTNANKTSPPETPKFRTDVRVEINVEYDNTQEHNKTTLFFKNPRSVPLEENVCSVSEPESAEESTGISSKCSVHTSNNKSGKLCWKHAAKVLHPDFDFDANMHSLPHVFNKRWGTIRKGTTIDDYDPITGVWHVDVVRACAHPYANSV